MDSGPSGSTGGVAGETADAAAVTETYWDTEATGVDESPVGSGLTTAEMTGPAARGNVSGFDFEFTWTVTMPHRVSAAAGARWEKAGWPS